MHGSDLQEGVEGSQAALEAPGALTGWDLAQSSLCPVPSCCVYKHTAAAIPAWAWPENWGSVA